MHYFRVIIICVIISILGILLMSCASQPRIWQSNCAGNTILAIITVGQEYPTRGRCSIIDGEYHIQSEYKKDGKWIPLQVMEWQSVQEGKIEFEGQESKLYYKSGKELVMEYYTRLKGNLWLQGK